MSTTLIIIPTYNEAESLPVTMAGVFKYAPEVDILVVDDNSPDGTGFVADRLSAEDSRVQVLHRSGKEGLGAAYLAGFRWALARNYDFLVEMDADGSHQPKFLPLLFSQAESSSIVLGSRWVSGGGTEGWSFGRKMLSRAGSLYARFMLGIPVLDMTGGFRVYSAEVLRSIPLDAINSAGYCFQIDILRRAYAAGFSSVEVPIVFVERVSGVSKMSRGIVFEALWRVTGWGFRRVFNLRKT